MDKIKNTEESVGTHDYEERLNSLSLNKIADDSTGFLGSELMLISTSYTASFSFNSFPVLLFALIAELSGIITLMPPQGIPCSSVRASGIPQDFRNHKALCGIKTVKKRKEKRFN